MKLFFISNSTNLQQITMNELTQTKDDFLENVLLFWIREIISIDENEQRNKWWNNDRMIYAEVFDLFLYCYLLRFYYQDVFKKKNSAIVIC